VPIKELEQLLIDFRKKHATALDELYRDGESLHEAAEQIALSWSGSFAGWHGKMYFWDFQAPSIGERFNGEWGGIQGIPNGWQEKQAEHVEGAIEALLENFSLKDFERSIDTLRKNIEELKTEISDRASQETIGTRATELLRQIEQSRVGKLKGEFIQQNVPTTLMSRDTEALRQGIFIPAWLYYVGVALSATSDRLRKLTGHETGSEAFGKSKLHIRGAAASNVDDDFNNG
jgi:hypothetical protein